jgi:hypothetical protein
VQTAEGIGCDLLQPGKGPGAPFFEAASQPGLHAVTNEGLACRIQGTYSQTQLVDPVTTQFLVRNSLPPLTGTSGCAPMLTLIKLVQIPGQVAGEIVGSETGACRRLVRMEP